MDCCKTFETITRRRRGEERWGVVEEYIWGLIGGGGYQRDFSDGEVCPKSNSSFKETIAPTEASVARKTAHVCICLVEERSRHDCAKSVCFTAGPAAGSMV